jgi:uncharacterized delta-60 repeat protein
MARYLPNGSLDPGFGSGGKVLFTLPNGLKGEAGAVMPLSGGKFLIAGTASPATSPGVPSVFQGFVARFGPAGTLDADFGTGGITSIPEVGNFRFERPESPADAGITLVGWKGSGSDRRLWLMPFNAAGVPGPVLTGTASAPIPLTSTSAAVQRDGKILVAGSALQGGKEVNVLSRFLSDGTPDASFSGGRVVIPFDPASGFGAITAVSAQRDGRIVAGGYDGNRFALFRFFSDGRLDDSFHGGSVTTSVGVDTASIAAVVIQADGRIVAGGYSRDPVSRLGVMTLARYFSGEEGEWLQTQWPPGTVLQSGGVVDTGSVMRGNPQPLETVMALKNTGPAPLTDITAVITGDPDAAARFAVTVPPSATLAPAATTEFTVRFMPLSTVSSFSAKILIRGNNPLGYGTMVEVRGATRPPEALLTLSADGLAVPPDGTVDFGPVPAAGRTRTLTIGNRGNIELTVQTVALIAQDVPDRFTAGALESNVIAAGASAGFPVTFQPSGSGTATARLRIVSTDTYSPAWEVSLAGRLATPSETWRLAHFGSARNQGESADLSDPDHDGIPNLIEYATLTNPADPAAASAGELSVNGDTLSYTFHRPSAAAAELTWALEWSDAQNPSWNVSAAAPSVLSDDGDRQLVKFSVPAGSGKRFVRLRVTRK